MYDFDMNRLISKASGMIDTYNAEIDRWIRAGSPKDIDNFVLNDESKIKWSSRLKIVLANCFRLGNGHSFRRGNQSGEA
jgi:hypothetical protein